MMKKKPVKRAAVIHDLCTVGKAAMTNILPALSAMGIEACPVPTMALSTHTGGFGKPAVHSLADFPVDAARHLRSCGVEFDAVFIGYLGSQEAVARIREWMVFYPHTEVLLDPIMADHGRYYANFDETYRDALKGILHYSRILTPNYTESCFLTGEAFEPVCSMEKLERICRGLESLGAVQIVITSVPCPETEMGIAVWESGKLSLLKKKKEGRAYPGTGDLFAAVLLGALLNGSGLVEAAEAAHRFVGICIRESDRYGYDVREGVLLAPCLRHLIY
ncbi:MAG: pyridoxamine kinase [Eubacteriales bacterium]|nr:pyridoxamine kinase [Eubacteriales bacterium]